MKRNKGFTLIEMLVVISIITLLAALLVVLIKGVMDRARNGKTHALVRSLDQMCHAYKVDYNVFPPASPYAGSANLHFYLGRNRTIVTQHNNDGSPAISVQRKPYTDFTRDQLIGSPANTYPNPPVQLMDAYGFSIQYINPGLKIPTGVDIWSMGKDGITNAAAAITDDIGNWIRDF